MANLIDAETGEVFSKPVMGGIEHTPDVGAIFGAIAKAQGLIKGAAKDSMNPHFKAKYADLAAIWEACRDVLAANSIAVIQAPYNEENGSVGILTVLGHESGQWIKSRIHVRPKDFTAQSVGSVITYLRRYSLAAMVGVAPAEDDDGNAASGRPSTNENDRTPIQKPGLNDQEKEAIRESISKFERTLSDQLAAVSDLETLDKLWRSGISAKIREIGQVDSEAQKKFIQLFSQKKSELGPAKVEAA